MPASAAMASTSAWTSSKARWPREAARRSPRAMNGRKAPAIGLAMLECGPPTEHRSGAQMALLRRRQLPPCRRIGRDGERLGHVAPSDRRIHSPAHSRRGRSTSSMPIRISAPHDTGTFASTGTVVAGQAVELHRQGPARQHHRVCKPSRRRRPNQLPARRRDGDLRRDPRVALTDLHAAGTKAGWHFEAKRRAYLSPRTIVYQRPRYPSRGTPYDWRNPHLA